MYSRCIYELHKESPDYPKLLKSLKDSPEVLYCIGNAEFSVYERALAVVGSRSISVYGEWVIRTIVKEVAANGVTIVSGFMYGADALAHRAALDAGGRTVAVMAGGVSNVMPRYQSELYDDICNSGLVLSEYRDSGSEGKWMFVRRNRIVAGLSEAVLVVEAAESSGSLNTAYHARRYGRKVLAVPGNINSENSLGTARLLKEGAVLVTCTADVLSAIYGNNYRLDKISAINTRLILKERNPKILTLYDYLSRTPSSADELSERLDLPVNTVLIFLTELLVSGNVLEKEGRYFAN